MADTVSYDGKILLSTFWDQEDPIKSGNNVSIVHNQYTPMDTLWDVRSQVGCVSTAMGQIVYYFLEKGWLDSNLSLKAEDSYVSFGVDPQRAVLISPEGGGTAQTLSFTELNDLLSDFVPVPTDPKAADYTVKSEQAAKYIAALNVTCGVLNRSSYSLVSGTAADAPLTVYERSGFKSMMSTEAYPTEDNSRWFTVKNVKGESKNVLTNETFEIFIENLLDGRPVLIFIPGHAVVLDGYDSKRDMFHINYGWGDPAITQQNDGPGGAEGTAASTKWYTRKEFSDLGVLIFQSELRTSYVKTFTVTDGRFYGSGTFLRAIEQANAMQGWNEIVFSADTADAVVELPYSFNLMNDVTIRDLNLNIIDTPVAPAQSEGEQSNESERTLFACTWKSSISFENFNGDAVLQAQNGKRDAIFNFSDAIKSELFFSGSNLYAGKYAKKIKSSAILKQLNGKNPETLLQNTEKAFTIFAAVGDDTILFDNSCFSIGNIDLEDGHNVLIVADESRIYGDISGSGNNNIFIDSTSSITGALLNNAELYITVQDVNKTAIWDITGNAEDTFKNISALTIDTTGAAAGEYILFSWQSQMSNVPDKLPAEKLIGNGTLAVKDNRVVLTVTDENAAVKPPAEGWNISAAQNGNDITLSWNGVSNAAGYAFRYARAEEALAGNGFETETNRAEFVLNNGVWYYQMRAFDEAQNYSDWSSAAKIVVNNTKEAVTDSYLANDSLSDQTFTKDFTVLSGGELRDTTISSGVLTLEEGSRTTGTLSITGDAAVKVYSGAEFIFDISSRDKENAQPVINDFNAIEGTFQFGIAVSDEQAYGTYILADQVNEWAYPLAIGVKAGDTLLGQFSSSEMEFVYGDRNFSFVYAEEEKQLQLVVKESVYSQAEENGITRLNWNTFAGVSAYTVEISNDENFENCMRIVTSHNALNIVTPLPKAGYWRTQPVGLDRDFTVGDEIAAGEISAKSQVYAADDSGADNIFVAAKSGVWEKNYNAHNMSFAKIKNEPARKVALEGMNRYQDIFQGSQSSEHNILFLSDDSNGDAFFFDDIYSASPDAQEQNRISNISNIYAGAGNDIIDMTSSRYEDANAEISIHGGDGDDIIWANSAGHYFGDKGNDTILGSSETDHIAGGAGDDKLHGGGGDDYFLYGDPETWGNDIIAQLGGGSVNLVFLSQGDILDEVECIYDDESNVSLLKHEKGSIAVLGRKLDLEKNIISCRNYENFDTAFALGGFDACSSGKIFENASSSGMLA